MKRINLLPPEVIAGKKARQEKALLGIVFGGVVFVLALAWLTLHLQLNQQRERLASAQAKTQTLQTKINALQPFALLEQSIKTRTSTLSGAMVNDIAWSALLRDVSGIIPSNSWLTAFTGTADETAGGSVPAVPSSPPGAAAPPAPAGAAAAPAGAPAGGTAPGPPAAGTPPAAPALSPGAAAAAGTLPPRLGTLNFTVVTFDFPGVAGWLTTLEKLGALQNIFVSTATKTTLAGREVVNFSSTADLSQAARSGRYQRRP